MRPDTNQNPDPNAPSTRARLMFVTSLVAVLVVVAFVPSVLGSPEPSEGRGLVAAPPAPTIPIAGPPIQQQSLSAIESESSGTLVVAAFDSTAAVRRSADLVCDGVDDHVQIQQALDSVSQTGGTVVLASGEFRTDATLLVTGDGVRLTGLGPATRLTSSNLGAHVLLAIGDGFELDHLAIGHYQPQTRNTKYVVFVERSAGVAIHDVEVTAGTAAGILLNGVSDSTVTSNVVHDTLADGIHVTGASTRVTISGNNVYDTGDDSIAAVGYQSAGEPNTYIRIVENNAARSHANGIKVEGTDHAVVERNYVADTRSNGIIVSHSAAWRTFGANDVRVAENLVVAANTFADPIHNGHGIFVVSSDRRFGVAKVDVFQNVVVGGGQAMIFVGSASANSPLATFDVALVGNRLVGPNQRGAGIQIEQAMNVTISRNSVSSPAGHPIHIARSVRGTVLVSENDVTDRAALR